MKFIHVADLHLGKNLKGFSLEEDQKYILGEIAELLKAEEADAIVISGDVYDKSVPVNWAANVFNDFIVEISDIVKYIFIISGNHDSADRIAFGGDIFKKEGIFISGNLVPSDGSDIYKKFTVDDEYGPVNFYLLPFIKPVNVRSFYPDAEIESYNDAVKTVVDDMDVDANGRNVLLAHQFVTGGDLSGSEERSVGGTENVSGELFGDFDYVALGHLHLAQSIGRDTVRYAGSPLKYSFSRAELIDKSVTEVTMGPKGEIDISLLPLKPMRDMIQLPPATFSEVTSSEFMDSYDTKNDFFKIILTDDKPIPDAANILREYYPNYVEIVYQGIVDRLKETGDYQAHEEKSPMEMFREFYSLRNNGDMSDEAASYVEGLIREIWNGGDDYEAD